MIPFTLTRDRMDDIIQDAGYETTQYSGRGMYGDECLGFRCDDEIAAVAEIVGSVYDSDERREVVKLFRGAEIDNLGKGYIIYFRRLKYGKEKE